MLILFIYLIFSEFSSLFYCQSISSNCSFVQEFYYSHSSVSEQIHFINQTSIHLTAHHAFLSTIQLSILKFGLIYQFPSSDYLVPFPILFTCATMVQTCQLKMIPTSTIPSRHSEAINVQLTPLNFTSNRMMNIMGLYLKQGRYQLSHCSFNNGELITDPQMMFDIHIQYEKSIDSSCDSTVDICGSRLLTTCSASKCTCLSSSNSLVSYSDSFYCADMIDTSNCTIFPSRCITWCNETTNYLCICPSETLKIQRNQSFVCEFPPNANNCSSNDRDIRRCPWGQCCFDEQCVDCSIIPATISLKSRTFHESFDDHLRIVLGIVVGLLGISVIILLGTFAWLRLRGKSRRQITKKSLSDLSTSSLYITPIQQPTKDLQLFAPIAIYPKFSRTNSFRRAVLSDTRFPYLIERVSTKPDYYSNDDPSKTFNGLEYVIPTSNNINEIDKSNHIYQIILPPTPVLTHAV